MKGRSLKSVFSIGTVIYLKGSFFGLFADLGAVGGEVTGCSFSESDSKTSSSSTASDSQIQVQSQIHHYQKINHSPQKLLDLVLISQEQKLSF